MEARVGVQAHVVLAESLPVAPVAVTAASMRLARGRAIVIEAGIPSLVRLAPLRTAAVAAVVAVVVAVVAPVVLIRLAASPATKVAPTIEGFRLAMSLAGWSIAAIVAIIMAAIRSGAVAVTSPPVHLVPLAIIIPIGRILRPPYPLPIPPRLISPKSAARLSFAVIEPVRIIVIEPG